MEQAPEINCKRNKSLRGKRCPRSCSKDVYISPSKEPLTCSPSLEKSPQKQAPGPVLFWGWTGLLKHRGPVLLWGGTGPLSSQLLPSFPSRTGPGYMGDRSWQLCIRWFDVLSFRGSSGVRFSPMSSPFWVSRRAGRNGTLRFVIFNNFYSCSRPSAIHLNQSCRNAILSWNWHKHQHTRARMKRE